MYGTCDYKMTPACLNYSEAPLTILLEKLTKWEAKKPNTFFLEGISQSYSLFLFTLDSTTFSCPF